MASDDGRVRSYAVPASSKVIALDAHRPGWWKGYALCCGCAHWWPAIAHPEANLDTLECPECGDHNSIACEPLAD